jgi:YVTN family beta-propeller protein
MNARMSRLFAIVAFVALGLLASGQGYAQNAYITNQGSNNVSVIATATNTVIGSPIAVGNDPYGVAVTPDGSKVYVTNFNSNNVSVIATATNTVIATIPVGGNNPVGNRPVGVAVTPDGSKVYVANAFSDNVSVIATATNTVTANINCNCSGPTAFGIFIMPAAVR